ncbi:iron-sulfur cluster biosynthesis family protein [Bacillus sp. FSL K6-3149]|uniref:iron-sulfur cluster biosynthesis family protein n=1 Tax=Bacillus sp. FSL K6-3149 TaxID=2921488 RepID=UPI00315A9F05
MYIHITEKAKTYIEKQQTGNETKELLLRYDSEGCGCAVSGVPMLWLTSERTGEWEQLKNSQHLKLYIHIAQKVFFDEEMTIDFNEKANTLMLKSPQQILSPRMGILVK